ncbi:MAG: hypothetical protein NVSMB3_02470 [Acidobacteriaceae bacterium]
MRASETTAGLAKTHRSKVSNGIVRTLLTILMYCGVAVFCIPYILGKVDSLGMLQVGGAVAAVVFGMLRCYWSEEECWWHVQS